MPANAQCLTLVRAVLPVFSAAMRPPASDGTSAILTWNVASLRSLLKKVRAAPAPAPGSNTSACTSHNAAGQHVACPVSMQLELLCVLHCARQHSIAVHGNLPPARGTMQLDSVQAEQSALSARPSAIQDWCKKQVPLLPC